MLMDDFFSRSEALLGEKTMEALRHKRVILFGVGGVGSWCAEALIRTGLTHLTIVDGDTVQPSNINRQLPATRATMDMPKVEALKARLLEINPDADIVAGVEMGTTLTNEDVACKNELTVRTLGPETLGFAVAAVAGTTNALFVCKKLQIDPEHS